MNFAIKMKVNFQTHAWETNFHISPQVCRGIGSSDLLSWPDLALPDHLFYQYVLNEHLEKVTMYELDISIR